MGNGGVGNKVSRGGIGLGRGGEGLGRGNDRRVIKERGREWYWRG